MCTCNQEKLLSLTVSLDKERKQQQKRWETVLKGKQAHKDACHFYSFKMFKEAFLYFGLANKKRPLHKTKDHWDQYLQVSLVFSTDLHE